jgi:hypothetical protein
MSACAELRDERQGPEFFRERFWHQELETLADRERDEWP